MANTKEVVVNGATYTIQKLSPREWARLRDRSKNRHGQPVEENLLSEILKHMVIEPKLTLDDFQEWDDLQEVCNEAIVFQLGRTAPTELL